LEFIVASQRKVPGSGLGQVQMAPKDLQPQGLSGVQRWLVFGTILVLAIFIIFIERERLPGQWKTYSAKPTATSPLPRSRGRKCNSGQRNFAEHQNFSKSQQGEDAFLWQYFGDMCGGSYIELGALDGITFSNSHIFNRALNWSGVLIEASPTNAALLMGNRPNDTCINAAVCQMAGVVHYLEGGAVGGIWEFMPDSFRNYWHKGKTMSDSIEVPCAPLSEIVRNHTDQEFFDFLSLDVEGGEFSVIQTINTLKFGMVLVEADEHNARKNSMVETFLTWRGYIRIHEKLGINQIYINSQFDQIYGDIK